MLLVLAAFLPMFAPLNVASHPGSVAGVTLDAHGTAHLQFVVAPRSTEGPAPQAATQPADVRTSGVRLDVVSGAGGSTASTSSGQYFDYLVTIVLENHSLCEILTTCNGTATYMTSLANASGLARNYTPVTNPSLPNYLALTGGSDFGCTGNDGLPNSNPCTRAAWNATNVVDRLEGAGLTWKAYMEDMTTNCQGNDSGLYVAHHNPFVYYGDIVDNPGRCARDLPAGTSDAALLSGLDSSTNASHYMW